MSRLLFTGCWLCVDAELAIGQCRLGVHGTCGLMSSWVENPSRPPMWPLMSQQDKTKRAQFLQCTRFRNLHNSVKFYLFVIQNIEQEQIYQRSMICPESWQKTWHIAATRLLGDQKIRLWPCTRTTYLWRTRVRLANWHWGKFIRDLREERDGENCGQIYMVVCMYVCAWVSKWL